MFFKVQLMRLFESGGIGGYHFELANSILNGFRNKVNPFSMVEPLNMCMFVLIVLMV